MKPETLVRPVVVVLVVGVVVLLLLEEVARCFGRLLRRIFAY